MKYRIIRGALLGIFLGVTGSLAIVFGLFMKKVYEKGKATPVGAEVLGFFKGGNEDALSDEIPEVIRFHVKANSDSEEDIKLKYEVRDEVIKLLNKELSACNTLSETESLLDKKLPEINAIARETVFANGFDYGVNVYMTYDEFPMRQYGELVLPAGKYRALRVDIGEAGGENFWCLIYPAVCYTVDSGAVISRQDGEEVCRKLNEDEYEELFVKKEVPKEKVTVRFRFFEFIKDIF